MLALARQSPEVTQQHILNCQVIRMTLAISQRSPAASESMALSGCPD
jgi:hypothetical protein